MNFHVVKYLCGQVLKFEAAFMTLSLAVALLYGEYRTAFVFGAIILAVLGFGFLLTVKKPANTSFYAKEGVVTVSLSWILISIFGAMPFYITGAIPSLIDSLFESISGFTTTGASILNNVETMENSLLFWRSFTHWVGGMGVLMFVMAILPMSGADPLYMMKAESPGPTTEKLVPKAQQTAKILYLIYIGMTMLEIILLLFGGMPLFDSVVHAFGTAGTGGFSNRNASIGAYNSVYLETVVTIFMLLFGVNFSAYFLLIARQYKKFFRHEEMRVYFVIVLIAVAALIIDLTGTVYRGFGESLRYASFQVVSIMTTTGFATADFDQWPTFSKFVIMFLMYVGACAGSTGGGIKVSRFMIMVKSLKREAVRILHPKAVSRIAINRITIEESVISGTGVFVVTILLISALSILIVSMDGFHMEASASAVVACINNIGPGLKMVSPAGNYSQFSDLSKIVLSVNMLIGRLELYPILLLLSPSLWRRRG